MLQELGQRTHASDHLRFIFTDLWRPRLCSNPSSFISFNVSLDVRLSCSGYVGGGGFFNHPSRVLSVWGQICILMNVSWRWNVTGKDCSHDLPWQLSCSFAANLGFGLYFTSSPPYTHTPLSPIRMGPLSNSVQTKRWSIVLKHYSSPKPAVALIARSNNKALNFDLILWLHNFWFVVQAQTERTKQTLVRKRLSVWGGSYSI